MKPFLPFVKTGIGRPHAFLGLETPLSFSQIIYELDAFSLSNLNDNL